MTMSDESHSRATTASIDRRVERLEVGLTDTNRKVDQIVVQLASLSQMTDLKLSMIQTALDLQGSKLDGFIVKMERMLEVSVEASGDLLSTPAGRAVDERLGRLEGVVLDHSTYVEQQRGLGGAVRQYLLPLAMLVVAGVALANSLIR